MAHCDFLLSVHVRNTLHYLLAYLLTYLLTYEFAGVALSVLLL